MSTAEAPGRTTRRTSLPRAFLRATSSGVSASRASGFLVGAGWLFSAQLVARVARLGTTLVVARLLLPEHFGIVAIALTVHELALVVARFITTPAIVRCDDADLERTCRAAWSLNWLVGGVLFVLQCALALPVAHLYGAPEIALPVAVLAPSYLLLPLGAVNVGLSLRRGDMRPVADAEVRQAIGDMALAVALALAGFGLWSLVLPKLAVIPLWIAVHRRASPWRATGFTLAGTGPLLRFGTGIVGVEALGVLRHSVDYLLIGLTLGVEALGVYFFAFNAGLGITRGLLSALATALLPDLCRGAHAGMNARYVRGAATIVAIVGAWVALQASLAPWYVPLVFGTHWVEHGAVPLLVLICLCGVPMALVESGAQYLRARGEAARDLAWNGGYSLVFTLGIVAGLQYGITGVACAVLVTSVVNAPLYLHFNVGPVMRRATPASPPTSPPSAEPST